MAKKKITVEEGGKLNEQVESLVEKSSSNHVDNKSSQASDPLTDAGVHELIEGQKQYARITVHAEFNKKFSKWTEIDPLDATDDDIAATDEK